MKHLISVVIFIAWSILVVFTAWASGWNFERGFTAFMVIFASVSIGGILAGSPILFNSFGKKKC